VRSAPQSAILYLRANLSLLRFLQHNDFPVTRILRLRRMIRAAVGIEMWGVRLKLPAEAVD
jgi:hypothetical protein